ncbi:hypothetical protein J6590_046310 [Homalodisca vitripennis]|nr:hypothetical protein J6590_046310 [Homalodisca vitripennis]
MYRYGRLESRKLFGTLAEVLNSLQLLLLYSQCKASVKNIGLPRWVCVSVLRGCSPITSPPPLIKAAPTNAAFCSGQPPANSAPLPRLLTVVQQPEFF